MVTIADGDSGTTTVLTTPPVFSRSVSCVPDTFVILPRSRLNVCGFLFSVTLMSACDHAPGRRGNGGTVPAPAAPSRAMSEEAARGAGGRGMDQLTPPAAIPGLLLGKEEVKPPPARARRSTTASESSLS